MLYDKKTQEWFDTHIDYNSTVCKCQACGLYYKPSLGHDCIVGEPKNLGQPKWETAESVKVYDSAQDEPQKPCPWCKNKTVATIEWSVIDDDFGQHVHPNLIKYCFSCGRKLGKGKEK